MVVNMEENFSRKDLESQVKEFLVTESTLIER